MAHSSDDAGASWARTPSWAKQTLARPRLTKTILAKLAVHLLCPELWHSSPPPLRIQILVLHVVFGVLNPPRPLPLRRTAQIFALLVPLQPQLSSIQTAQSCQLTGFGHSIWYPERRCSRVCAAWREATHSCPFVSQFYGQPSQYLWEDDEGVCHAILQGEAASGPRQPENSKQAHLRVPALRKHHQKSTRRPPREGRKNENCGGRGKKSAKFRAPTLRAPTLRGLTLRGPTFFCVWAPTLVAPLSMAPPWHTPDPKLDWPKLVKSGWPKRDWPKSVSSCQACANKKTTGLCEIRINEC